MRCYQHPDREAVGSCVSCGRGVCSECQQLVGGRMICPACSAESSDDLFELRFGFRDFGRAFHEFLFSTSRCPQCHRVVRREYRICPFCAAQLKRVCSRCGKPLESDWVVCPYCGQRPGL